MGEGDGHGHSWSYLADKIWCRITDSDTHAKHHGVEIAAAFGGGLIASLIIFTGVLLGTQNFGNFIKYLITPEWFWPVVVSLTAVTALSSIAAGMALLFQTKTKQYNYLQLFFLGVFNAVSLL